MREVDIPDAAGNPVSHLELAEADGTVFFRCHRGANRAVVVDLHIRYPVRMWSMKARGTLDTFQVLRATGFSADARGHGRLFLSPEGTQVLDQRIQWYDAELARMRGLGADQRGHEQYGDYRRTRWR